MSILGGQVSNESFRAGYSGTFGVIIALMVNAIVLLVLDLFFGGFSGMGYFKVLLYLGTYVFLVSMYVSSAMDENLFRLK